MSWNPLYRVLGRGGGNPIKWVPGLSIFPKMLKKYPGVLETYRETSLNKSEKVEKSVPKHPYKAAGTPFDDA